MSDFVVDAFDEGYDNTQDYLDELCRRAMDENSSRQISDSEYFYDYNNVSPEFMESCDGRSEGCPDYFCLYCDDEGFPICHEFDGNSCNLIDSSINDNNEITLTIEPNSEFIIENKNDFTILFEQYNLILIENNSLDKVILEVEIYDNKFQSSDSKEELYPNDGYLLFHEPEKISVYKVIKIKNLNSETKAEISIMYK